MSAEHLAYYLGLPAWAFPGWSDRFFPRSGPGPLYHYSRVFNTVEGNTTFYRTPDAETVARWREAVAGRDFRFCFKLPRTVTHERRPDWDELRRFMAVLEPLEEHLGPFLVQFPSSLSPRELTGLDALMSRLPEGHRYAVEVRHRDFFSRPELLEPLLERYRAARVMFDSRPIYGGDRDHPEVLAARHQKPDVPLLETVYNGLVFARVVLHPDAAYNADCIGEWVTRVAQYLSVGHRVYFLMHCPNNQHCPDFALQFHRALQARWVLPDLPAWPLPQQPSLF